MSDSTLATALRTARVVLDEVERAVIGKRDVLELVLMGFLADGHVLLDDLPGVAKTLDGALVRDSHGAWRSGASSSPPTCFPRTSPAPRCSTSARRPSRSGRARCSRTSARRRGEPRAGQDPGRVARGDAGAAGDRRWRHATSARAAVPRRRDAEPDRVRGHLPTSGGAARPLHPAHRSRLPVGRRRVESARSPNGARHGRGRAEGRHRLRRGCARCRPRSNASTSTKPSAATWSRSIDATRARVAAAGRRQPRGTLALMKLGRAHAFMRGRDFVTPDDMKAIVAPALAHRVVLRSDLWVRRVAARRRAHRARRRGAGAVGRVSEPIDLRRQRQPSARRGRGGRDGGLFGSILAGRPALVAVAAPFAVLLRGRDRARGTSRGVASTIAPAFDRVVAGDDIDVAIDDHLERAGEPGRVLAPAAWVGVSRPTGGRGCSRGRRQSGRRPASIPVRLHASRWGVEVARPRPGRCCRTVRAGALVGHAARTRPSCGCCPTTVRSRTCCPTSSPARRAART